MQGGMQGGALSTGFGARAGMTWAVMRAVMSQTVIMMRKT